MDISDIPKSKVLESSKNISCIEIIFFRVFSFEGYFFRSFHFYIFENLSFVFFYSSRGVNKKEDLHYLNLQNLDYIQ